jgi:hypothetical protein
MASLPPLIFNLVAFTLAITGLLVLGGVLFGLSNVLEYERRRRLREGGAYDTPMGAPLIGAT